MASRFGDEGPSQGWTLDPGAKYPDHMPWSIGDVERHNKGLSSAQKAKWVTIANSILASGKDEAYAIRVANAKVREVDSDSFGIRDEIDRLREADDDHPYGPWGGGSKAQGGHPMGGGGASAAAQADPTKPRDRWASTEDIQKEMEGKYPGSDWSDINKLGITDANDMADTIDGIATRFGPPPNFRGVKVKGSHGTVLAEVKRDVPGVKGSSVYVYNMPGWQHKGMGSKKDFVGSASESLRQSKRATITHEMGHTYLGLNLHSRFGADRNDPVRQATEKWVTTKYLPNFQTAHVSRYARRNPHEAWAEVFTAAVSPSLGAKNQSHFPNELRGILDGDFPIKVTESASEPIEFTEAGSSLTPSPQWRDDIAAAIAIHGHVCGFAAAHPEFPLDLTVGTDDV